MVHNISCTSIHDRDQENRGETEKPASKEMFFTFLACYN